MTQMPRTYRRCSSAWRTILDEIVLLGAEEAFHPIAPDAASVLHVARETAGTFVHSQHESGGQLIVVSQDRWTQPSCATHDQAGRPVVAVLPPDAAMSDAPGPVASWALLTQRQVGLALGAGAAKGSPTMGVLRALDELAVPVDVWLAAASVPPLPRALPWE
jgi:hypothetical protein